MEIQMEINGKQVALDADSNMPLLWAIRDLVGLKGTKFGCGKGLCGACSVHVDGTLVRSCSYPLKAANGKKITTIEGLSNETEVLHPVQRAWMEVEVPQCGYCQPGFMMAAANFLEENPNPTESEIKEAITNICRCGTHPRIIKAILLASKL
jgi:isoquinoline 1-oxidoreductase subunit alpha